MMVKEKLESSRNSTEYLERLEKWYLLRWKRRLELLQETTADLWLLREVLDERHEKNDRYVVDDRMRIFKILKSEKAILNTKYGVIAFPKDEDNE